jgi:thymidine kinase
MFSGKTTELIRRLRGAQAGGQRVLAFKPLRDDRYAHGELVTHSGARLVATPVAAAQEIVVEAAGAAVVGIDEAHFFGASLVGPCEQLIGAGARVIVAGVERDHRGKPFEPFPELLVEADEVMKLSGPCAVCGKPALYSQRMVKSDQSIVVGGAEMYEARCRDCFEPGE